MSISGAFDAYPQIIKKMQLLNSYFCFFLFQATDRDEAGTVNSQIEFSIKPSTHSSSFSIDPNTGVFTNNGELDREALEPELNGRINLTVIATDKGTPALSSSVSVIINVQVGATTIYVHPAASG